MGTVKTRVQTTPNVLREGADAAEATVGSNKTFTESARLHKGSRSIPLLIRRLLQLDTWVRWPKTCYCSVLTMPFP